LASETVGLAFCHRFLGGPDHSSSWNVDQGEYQWVQANKEEGCETVDGYGFNWASAVKKESKYTE